MTTVKASMASASYQHLLSSLSALNGAGARSWNGALANQEKQDNAATTSAKLHNVIPPSLLMREALSSAAWSGLPRPDHHHTALAIRSFMTRWATMFSGSCFYCC